jgi:hypothetical protein
MDLIDLIKAWCAENGVGTSQMITDLDATTLNINSDIPHVKSVIRRLDKSKDKQVTIKKVRNGCSLRVNTKGINDEKQTEIIMNFRDKIEAVFEAQYKTNLSPIHRNKKRNRRGPNKEAPVKEEQYKTYMSPTDGYKKRSTLGSKDPKVSSAPKINKISAIIRTTEEPENEDEGFIQKITKFKLKLEEALDGIATKTSVQPQAYFDQFIKALDMFGKEQGMGSIRTKLSGKGIEMARSKDGQSLVLYVINAQTNAKQDIKQVPLSSLENNSKFEEELFNCIDLANGEAPGAFKQRQESLRTQEGAVRDLVSKVGPDRLNVDSEETGAKIARNT